MSEQEFESYLRLLSRFLHLSGGQREKIARELRDHMEDRLEELMARGHTRDEAIQSALDEFGDAAALAGDFGRIGQRRRWIMRTTGGIVGIAAAVLVVSFLLPENRRHVPAPSYSVAADNSEKPGVRRPASQPAIDNLTVSAAPSAESRAKLSRVLPEVVFPEGSTLEQVVDFLRSQGELSIDVNWNALSLVGVDRTATLSLNMHKVKFETALALALENVGGASGVNLGFDLSDGVVRISTREELDRNTILRVYDCKDLFRGGISDAQFQRLREVIEQETGKKLSQGAIELLSREFKTDAQGDLVQLIKRTIDPGSWEPEATTGSVTIYDGLLVMRHTSATHRSVVDLMAMMRETKLARGSSDTQGRGSSGAGESLAASSKE